MKVWAIITAKILTYSKLQIYNMSHSGKEKFSPWSRSFSVASFSRKRVRLFGRRTFFRISVFQKNWGSSKKNLKGRKKDKKIDFSCWLSGKIGRHGADNPGSNTATFTYFLVLTVFIQRKRKGGNIFRVSFWLCRRFKIDFRWEQNPPSKFGHTWHLHGDPIGHEFDHTVSTESSAWKLNQEGITIY